MSINHLLIMTSHYPSTTHSRERYTPGQTATSLAFMAERSLESHGAALLSWLRPGQQVLDLGCGPGTITSGIADRVFPGCVTGVDARREPLETARRLAEGCEQVNLTYTCATAYRLPFDTASFDLIFSHALMEHLEDPALALAEIQRVLRPGGTLVLASPDWDHFVFDQASSDVLSAIRLYRAIQEQNGGDTRAGQSLGGWVQEAGLLVREGGERLETYSSTLQIAQYLAAQLEAEGEYAAARALVRWSTRPGARFHQCWRHVIATKAD